MKNKLRYNKHDKVWVRKVEGKFEYFNILEWVFVEYKGNKGTENYCTEADFAEK